MKWDIDKNDVVGKFKSYPAIIRDKNMKMKSLNPIPDLHLEYSADGKEVEVYAGSWFLSSVDIKDISKEASEKVFQKPNKCKAFLVIAEIHDGEHEYSQYGLLRANTLALARKKADRKCQTHFGYGKDDYRTSQICCVQQLTDRQVSIIHEINLANWIN